MSNRLFMAQQMNAALRLLAQNLDITDSEKMQIADLYPEWEADKNYKAGTVFKYGLNEFDETQLWTTIKDVLSQAQYPPEADITAYKKIGYSESGIPIWTQPLTYDDAYDIGDQVEHPQGSGVIWICEQGNANGQYGLRNTFEPGVWGWSEK